MKKILTIIFDGFGMKDNDSGNAITKANMTNFNSFYNKYPHTNLFASEEKIGLLPGQMGNSEVGHMTIGAGRMLKSNKTLIDEFLISEYEMSENFKELVQDPNKRIHIVGLCSDGNVHASLDNFVSMYNLLLKNGIQNIYFHLITDGRDSKLNSAYSYIDVIQKLINKNKIGIISSICGRYYAMDRDENYDRTKSYYDLITKGVGVKVLNIEPALKSSYEKNIYDEFIKPTMLNTEGIIKDGDAVIWMNYRSDRSKQILKAFVDKSFDQFSTKPYNDVSVYTFFQVDKAIKTKYFIENENVENSLGIYLSKLGIKQARIAESEKYPHVTYFFDGGFNGKIEGCDKFHIPSPKVPTYDLKPEMSAVAVTKRIIDCMEKDYDFILANFANPDMVGHTGNMQATIKACTAIDLCLNKILESAENNFYTVVLLADHGNADTMLNEDGSVCTTHSLAKVPFIISDSKVTLSEDGDLTNVASTILDYMDISVPVQMTSESLIEK